MANSDICIQCTKPVIDHLCPDSPHASLLIKLQEEEKLFERVREAMEKLADEFDIRFIGQNVGQIMRNVWKEALKK
jgi:hypothetical protein